MHEKTASIHVLYIAYVFKGRDKPRATMPTIEQWERPVRDYLSRKSMPGSSEQAVYTNIQHLSRVVMQCVAVCCSVLHCVAVCCSLLQSVAVLLYVQIQNLSRVVRASCVLRKSSSILRRSTSPTNRLSLKSSRHFLTSRQPPTRASELLAHKSHSAIEFVSSLRGIQFQIGVCMQLIAEDYACRKY